MIKKSSKLQRLSDPLFTAIPDDMLRVGIVVGTSKIMETIAVGQDTGPNELVTGAD